MTASTNPSSIIALPGISAQRPRYQPPERQRDIRGDRYNHKGAFDPRTSLSKLPRTRNADLATVAIPDPMQPGKRLLANVNRRVDVLEMERSHGRISETAYEAGRQAQAIFERASGAGLGSAGWERVSRDQVIVRELSMIYAVEDARLVAKLKAKVVRAAGVPGARFLHEVLTGRKTFGEFADARGKGGDRGTAYIAEHFRILLENLDAEFAAEGVLSVQKRFFQGERTGEETDARGKVVPAGHGHAWGAEEARYAPQMNETARALSGRTAKMRDRVGARHRVTVDERS